MSRCCVNSVDPFCYLCGEVMLASHRCSLTPQIKKAYHMYFGCKLGDQDKKWAPHIVCKSCSIRVGGWINRKGMAMPFAIPVVWREPSKHINDCYFCLTPLVASGMNRKKESRELTIQIYPLPSDLCLMGKTCPCRSHQKNTIKIQRWKRKTRRKQDLTKKNLQIQTSKVQHLSHFTNLHKTN